MVECVHLAKRYWSNVLDIHRPRLLVISISKPTADIWDAPPKRMEWLQTIVWPTRSEDDAGFKDCASSLHIFRLETGSSSETGDLWIPNIREYTRTGNKWRLVTFNNFACCSLY